MSRPREYDGRTSTSVRFPPELHAALTRAAEERDVSVNWLVNKAVADFLARLIPADEIVWTRDDLARVRATPTANDIDAMNADLARITGHGPPVAEAPPGAPSMFFDRL